MLDLLKLRESIDKLNETTLPMLDKMAQDRIEQFHRALAANIEDLTALVDRLEAAIASLNGMNITLKIPSKEK